ncbi:TonB-dependent receptor [Ilyomonas limi]|uniref:TonB-dependent receptor n=2 Tax=Ilyomonas limi TaxID=2575867 RepID=A0A4U3L965_9BACT|nr:TonB-dependent receptor [Ilyomonas limi]
MQLHAQSSEQSNLLKTVISIDADRLPLQKILSEISTNSGVKLAYDVNEVSKYIVTLHDKRQFTIEDVLNKALQNTGLTYQAYANTIVIFNKAAKGTSAAVGANNHLVQYATYKEVQQKITGKVVDENGPVQNASVFIKGTSTGTITDAKGNFELEADAGEVTIVVSIVGYKSREVKLTAGGNNVIQLEHEDNQLEKVVVVGYGTQSRAKVTGAVADVKLDKITSRSVSGIGDVLQGKAPGVIVQNEGGDPTSQPRVYIRGLGGINGESALYVVDGVIYSGTPVINPNEIESIDVLKDASAAIYGARASGGVILITTKKGKAGAATVTLDAKLGSQTPWRKLHSLNAKEYADVMNLAADNAGVARLPAFDASVYPDGQITRTDWINEVFRTGPVNDYNVNITGGNDKSKYFTSFGYRKADGILLNTYTERYNFRFNSDHQLKPWLKFGENMQYAYTNGNGANTSSAYTGALLASLFYPPSIAPYTADGSFSGLPVEYAGNYGDVINPVAYLKRLDSKTPVNTLLLNPYVDIKIMDGLNFHSNFSITKSFSSNKSFSTKVPEIGKIFDYNQLSQTASDFTDLLAEQTVNYNKKFGLHTINAVAGYTYQNTKSDYVYVFAQGFDDESEAYRYFQNATQIFQPSSGHSESALISYLARVNYDYAGKYLLSVLGRRDGSSLVAEKNKFENYGSASAGWVISRENFMAGTKNWLSNLKIRGSYGVLGNLGSLPVNAVNQPLAATASYFGAVPTVYYGYAENTLSNPDLKWATSKQANVGLDAGFMGNRLSLTADYFVKTTGDMILQIAVPSTAGVTNGKWINAGEARDKGIELGINYSNGPQAAFQYSIGATFTKVSNTLLSLNDSATNISTSGINIRSTLTPVIIQTGQTLYAYNVVQTAGIFKTEAEVNSYVNKDGGLIQPNAKPGDLKFVDANGDGVINDNDRVVKGSAYPKFSYGFSFNAAYKGFDLNVFLQGVQGNKLFNGLKYLGLQSSVSGQNYNMLEDIKNAWSPSNPNADIPRVSLSDPNGNFSTTSDWFIEDGSYMRVKNLTLGYTLPATLTERLHLNTLRVYATANNLFTFTNYSGFDPEVGMDNYGIDIGRYPQARTILFGLNVNF